MWALYFRQKLPFLWSPRAQQLYIRNSPEKGLEDVRAQQMSIPDAPPASSIDKVPYQPYGLSTP